MIGVGVFGLFALVSLLIRRHEMRPDESDDPRADMLWGRYVMGRLLPVWLVLLLGSAVAAVVETLLR